MLQPLYKQDQTQVSTRCPHWYGYAGLTRVRTNLCAALSVKSLSLRNRTSYSIESCERFIIGFGLGPFQPRGVVPWPAPKLKRLVSISAGYFLTPSASIALRLAFNLEKCAETSPFQMTTKRKGIPIPQSHRLRLPHRATPGKLLLSFTFCGVLESALASFCRTSRCVL